MKFKICKWDNFMQYYYDCTIMEFEDAHAAWQYCRDNSSQTGYTYHHLPVDYKL
jgi:hypothetical protein